MKKYNILVIGCGGREHAIFKSLKLSNIRRIKIHANILNLFCFGEYYNPGIEKICNEYYSCVEKYSTKQKCLKIISYAIEKQISIAIIGPEVYLEAGLTDLFHNEGIPCIGPTKQLAKLETDKIFTRRMMESYWGLSTFNPWFALFTKNGIDSTTEYLPHYKLIDINKKLITNILSSLDGEYVIKASGLKSGKGVKVSGDHLKNFDEAYKYCEDLVKNNEEFLIEKKLRGNEFSLMSWCDGHSLSHMPIVKDFKRANENDQGPNTGGMGSVSYPNHRLPFLTEDDIERTRLINNAIISNLQSYTNEVYIGILYGSFIKTPEGSIKVIEYNCRFGDPECINVLNILETDFYDICDALITKNLSQTNIEYKKKYTICKYLVPRGYPQNPVKNEIIKIPEEKLENIIFANVSEDNNGDLVELGSRTLAIIESGDSITELKDLVNDNLEKIEGSLFFRKDIGNEIFSYLECGVDIDKGNEIIRRIKEDVESTFNDKVINNFGDYGGLFKFKDEILVSSTDGVGTKSILSVDILGEDAYYGLGKDLVNHCINDILVKGSTPLFFLDYFASSNINKRAVQLFVKGISKSCKDVGCVLIGGETAEMPDIYNDNRSDLVGTIVGSVKPNELINGKKDIKSGDTVIGLASSGPHTNGYSLIRKLYDRNLLSEDFVTNNLLEPHRCYYHDITKIKKNKIKIHGLCHITGGGLVENPKRILPENVDMKIDINYSKTFNVLREKSGLSDEEFAKIFNCGIGMLVFISKKDEERVLKLFDKKYATIVGKVIERKTNQQK